MFHKILIPLDGSPASEVSLAYLDHLRSQDILLARVYAQPSAAEECSQYLKRVRSRLPSVLDVQLACVPGEPAEAILGLAESAGCDLILLTSHGGCGFSASIAEKVTRNATCPVLLVGRQVVAPMPDAAAQAALTSAQELLEGCL